jgi:hypothetical protein
MRTPSAGFDTPPWLPCHNPARVDDGNMSAIPSTMGNMSATPSEEQGVLAGETPVAQRSLTTDLVAYALGAATSDVVTDAYGGIKAAGKAVVDKLRDRGPQDQEPDPPGADPPS